jgi:hypothetical protein
VFVVQSPACCLCVANPCLAITYVFSARQPVPWHIFQLNEWRQCIQFPADLRTDGLFSLPIFFSSTCEGHGNRVGSTSRGRDSVNGHARLGCWPGAGEYGQGCCARLVDGASQGYRRQGYRCDVRGSGWPKVRIRMSRLPRGKPGCLDDILCALSFMQGMADRYPDPAPLCLFIEGWWSGCRQGSGTE